MNKQPKIFVIVVTYKGMQWYDKCFSSLRESTLPVQTIVVDNTPGEEDANYIREHYPEILVMKPEQNLGFGKGNNLGIRYALDNGADYVFLLNQDAWIIDNNTFISLVNCAESDLELGIISPMHIKADHKSLYIEIEDGRTDHANQLLSDCYFQCLKDIYYFKYINAAAWLLPRKTLEIVGGFDPLFHLYGEDDNYLQRVEYHKLRVGLVPKVCIVHDHLHTGTINSDYRKQQYRWVQFLNILSNNSPCKNILSLNAKILKSLLLFRYKRIVDLYKDLLFVICNYQKISNSRLINSKVGRSWL